MAIRSRVKRVQPAKATEFRCRNLMEAKHEI